MKPQLLIIKPELFIKIVDIYFNKHRINIPQFIVMESD
jgi:hypothetical protein